ncbi:uncharacterized protein Z518_05127 [Rhinocladiella mackenziei CBS 650.93]|uniref:Uncharacterized protein n=1 Tax=Rhinocladiella mackenziei CBS 650.93 TaxID=1442369 RepID=A0A0D2JDA6_9EURO|nr:uncharacterized protein Z518_05127 [Rhinocladiella mackenziei CBS 650.93]KIX07150.1 hypothetical protein Z518_05127 [Rhinocladiella mackenziei CBS 650.93]
MSQHIQQQITQNTCRKRAREKESSTSVSSGVNLVDRVPNHFTKIPRPPPPSHPRKSSSRQLCKTDPPRPSSLITTQPFNRLTSHPSSDAEIPVPDTSPRQIHALWTLVMPPKKAASGIPQRVLPRRGAAASRTANQKTEVETASRLQNVAYDAATAISQNTTMTKGTAITKDTSVSRLTAVEKWRQTVLVPRGIELVNSPLYESAFYHFHYFGTDEDQCREWTLNRVESGKNEDMVFLRGGPDFNTNIARQYKEMASRRLCEEEFATLAKTKLFTTPDFLPIEGEAKGWKAQRTIQLYTQPDSSKDSLWGPPPLLSGEEYSGKDFNLRPDCAYWLSIQSFSESNRGLVSMATFTVEDRDTTPYLTIEFKKSESTVEQAINKAIAASSLALFNRFRLKENSLRAAKKNWNPNHFDQIRHYMMTFTGPKAIIWLVKLKLSAASDESCSKVTWNGCEAVRLLQCDCKSAGGVGDLVDYINAIHRWGLVHGAYCRRDVKRIILTAGGFEKRVSDLFDPDDPIEDEEDGQAMKTKE